MASEGSARIAGDEQVGVPADDGSGGPVAAVAPAHRFDVELLCEVEGVDGKSRHWQVIAEDVGADYAQDALKDTVSSGETWKPTSYGAEVPLAGDTPTGRFRVVERGRWGSVHEFDVDVIRVVSIRSAEDALPDA